MIAIAPAESLAASLTIQGALEEVLSKHLRAGCRIARVHRRRSAYSSSYSIENLRVEVAGGDDLRLILKDLSPAAVLAFGCSVRPSLVYCPEREITVYQKLLHPGLRTPFYFGAVRTGEVQGYWLFLERVPGVPLWYFGSLGPWKEAARWLARMHSEFSVNRRGPLLESTAHLLRYDQQYYLAWLRRAEEFLSRQSDADRADLRRFGRLADRYERVVEQLLALPHTLVHGEFYASNVLVRRGSRGAGEGEGRVCPIDWEMAGVGPGLMDLAALTSGSWPEEARQQIVDAYRQPLEALQGEVPPLNELLRAVEYCQLQAAVQWLGWAEAWCPPDQHAHDWLHEALRLAARLGI